MKKLNLTLALMGLLLTGCATGSWQPGAWGSTQTEQCNSTYVADCVFHRPQQQAPQQRDCQVISNGYGNYQTTCY